MHEIFHVIIAEDAVSARRPVGQKIALSADIQPLGSAGRRIIAGELRKADAVHAMLGVFMVVAQLETIPTAQPFDRFAHQRDSGKGLARLIFQPRADMAAPACQIGVLQRGRTQHRRGRKGFERGLDRGRAGLWRGQKGQMPVKENKHLRRDPRENPAADIGAACACKRFVNGFPRIVGLRIGRALHACNSGCNSASS